MTVAEEIEHAMQHGASTMFLIGLLRMDGREAMKAIAKAGELVRKRREVKIKLKVNKKIVPL